MKKTLLQLALIVAVAFTLHSCVVGRFMAHYALTPTPHGVDDIERTRHKADSLLPGSTAWYDGYKAQGILKDTNIVGNRGFSIHACYIPAARPKEANGTAIVVHGYGDNHLVFLYLVRMYRDDLNYNVLFPDLQYHGYSQGDHIQMGWYDRLDLERWIEVAHNIFRNNFMVLHGVSMGAATVMMASGDELPFYVTCAIEDCGYTSARYQFNKNLADISPILPRSIITSASIVAHHDYGWTFEEASSLDQLRKSTIPMLFIHGTADDFVPFTDLQKNYDAKIHGYKEKWAAEGAVHANSFAKYPEEYKHKVSNFLKTVHNMIAVGNYPDGPKQK